ncbi:MAG: GGDEF domain-containing protein [Gammaproteobacteria bacterium]|nr:GGDEF domain-containing protein [Gammaproteobacteria bacterium]
MLKRLALLLQKGINQSNIIGRWASDEFLIIYPTIDQEKLTSIAIKICSHIQSSHSQDVGNITVSIGCCTHWQSDSSAASIIKNADIALQQAKQNGMNQLIVYEPALHTDQ